MATSGKQFLSATAADIVKESLQLIGAIAEGETVSATNESDCIRSLNYMIKGWQGRHMGNLWAIESYALFPKKNQAEYNLSATSTDHFCPLDNLITTHIQTAASASDTSVVLDSIVGISDNDKIGIQTTNNVIEWFDVSGTPSGNTVNIDGGTTSLLADAAVDNVVYAYTPVAATFARPLQFVQAVVRDKPNASTNLQGIDIPVKLVQREGYINLTAKTITGRLNTIYYDPQLLTGKVSIWPMPDDETKYAVIWVRRDIEYFDANSQTVDYPQEWYHALAYNLAMYIYSKYGGDDKRFRMISGLALQLLKDAESNDTELGIQLAVDTDGDL